MNVRTAKADFDKAGLVIRSMLSYASKMKRIPRKGFDNLHQPIYI